MMRGQEREMKKLVRILIVDDEHAFRDILAIRLETKGLKVRTASKGEEALRILAGDTFDVVILDVLLPGIDGPEVLRRIKESHCRTEVIFLTRAVSVETALKGMKSGAFDYLMKPCDLDVLLARIQRAEEKLETEELDAG